MSEPLDFRRKWKDCRRYWSRFSPEETARSGGRRLYNDLLADNFASLSVPGPCSHRDIVEQIAVRSQKAINIDRLSGHLGRIVLTRGRTIFGSPGDYFDQIAGQYNLRWWISERGLTIDLCADTSPRLTTFDDLAGLLMSKVQRATNGRILRSEYDRITIALDKAGIKLLRSLERSGRKSLAQWNQKHPNKAIHTFFEAIHATGAPATFLPRAVRKRLYRAKDTWEKSHPGLSDN